MKKLLLSAIVLSSLAACAEPGPSSNRHNEDDYVTGSNLPRRGSMPPEARTVSKETIEDWQRARPGAKAPGMGF
jgi:hypothetical protein